MTILLLFAFLSGLVTIFAPCIWPLLPIILSSTTTGEKAKPLGITVGIVISFAFFTLTISYLVKLIPFDPNILRLFAVIVIGFLGLSLIIPKLSQILEGYVSRISGKFSSKTSVNRQGFIGGFITGLALGIVWSPCAGPILATIATLAATRSVNFQIILVTVVYVIGVGIPLLMFASFGARVFSKSRFLSKYTGRVQQIFGVIMILTALAIFTNFDKTLQANLLNLFPSYSQLLLKLETNTAVTDQLNAIRGDKKTDAPMPFPQAKTLPVMGAAPEFTGIDRWLNTDKPLTLASLRGKVVLVDFWTYTCINCIRTLPYVTAWYEKYKDKNFIVVGVHTPEFEFEHNTENVLNALKQYKIHYPVAQDNEYATWNAYDNHYWPAKYLIDAQGKLRYVHFGEGEYDRTEEAIQQLIEEAGTSVNKNSLLPDQNLDLRNYETPETYLGSARMERYAGDQVNGGIQTFTLSTGLPESNFSYGGTWDVQSEYAESLNKASLEFNVNANNVFLVITPTSKADRIKVLLDRQVIRPQFSGKDVKGGYILIDVARLYHLVSVPNDKKTHLLHLDFETPGTRVFAFTFG